jgi:beta-galactosidase
MFYDLADQWGFYICDEVNAECHYGQDYLASQPGWEMAFMDRTSRFLHRDKNHPSVIMWSMGNECGLAPIHYQMADYVRSADPTRFVYHQTNTPNGDAPFADICGTRYPNPAMLEAIGDTTRRPVILGEYAHAVANNTPNVKPYTGKWELYDLEKDRSETKDLNQMHPEKVQELDSIWDAWATRCNVYPLDGRGWFERLEK